MVKTLYDPEVERRGIEKGIEQGIEQGIEKGLLKGELKARRKTVYSLVEKKLGSIPEHLVELIEQADCQTLTTILDDIFDIDSFSELESYFPPED